MELQATTNTSKRLKRVFPSHSEVLHRWANQTQSDARCKNVYFEGNRVWSYGSHYELGRIVQFNGKTVAIINDSGYSVTTSKHISSAKSATTHLLQVFTDGDFETGCIRRGLVREQDKLVDDIFSHFSRLAFGSWSRAWGKPDSDGDVSSWDLSERTKAFNAKVTALDFPELALDINAEFIEVYNEKVADGMAKTAIRDAAKNEKQKAADAIRAVERAKQLEQSKGARELWHTGGGAFHQSLYQVRPMLLRVKGDKVETSGGASCTLSEARQLLKAAKAGVLKHGDAVGEYEFTRYEKNKTVLVIGCHEIQVAELERVLASKLSLVTESAD